MEEFCVWEKQQKHLGHLADLLTPLTRVSDFIGASDPVESQPALKPCPASLPPSSAPAGYLRAFDDAQAHEQRKRVTDWVWKQKTLKDNINARGSHRGQKECQE